MKLTWIGPAACAAGFFLSAASWADTSLEPRAAEMMPKAAQAILNDVTKAGDALIAVGDRGHILRSTDGKNWEQVQTPVQAMLLRSRFLTNLRGWTVGHDGTILATQDGGKSWSLMLSDTETGKPMYDILFLDEQRGFAVGANGIFKGTSDGGKNWELLEPDFTVPGLNLSNILQLADGTLVISGEKGMLARSTDEGETWEHVKTPYAGSFFGMMPFDESGVFVFGLRGNVYSVRDVKTLETQDSMEWDEFSLETVTDNAELSELGWHYYENDLKESLFGGVSLGRENVLLVGVNGAVVRTDSGRMRTIPTALEHTLGSALVTDTGLITVGLSGIQTIPVAP